MVLPERLSDGDNSHGDAVVFFFHLEMRKVLKSACNVHKEQKTKR